MSAITFGRAALAASRYASTARKANQLIRAAKIAGALAPTARSAYASYKSLGVPTPPNSPKTRQRIAIKPKKKTVAYKKKPKTAVVYKPPPSKATGIKGKTGKWVTRAVDLYKDQAGPNPTTYDRSYNMKGSVKLNEFGGSLTGNGTGAVYINHGVATNEFILSVYRAILKIVYAKVGCDIKNWNERPSVGNNGVVNTSALALVWFYHPRPSQNSNDRLSFTYIVPDNLTFSEIALALENYVRNHTVVTSSEDRLEFSAIHVLIGARNAVGNNSFEIPQCIIDLKEAKFDIKIKSTLILMNRTLAEPNAGETEQDRDDTTNIDQVPLKGKVYSGCKTWRNYIELNTRAIQINTPSADFTFGKKLVSDPDTGICQWVSVPSSVGNSGDLLSVPPRAYVLGYKSEKSVYIKPGDMTKNTFTFVTQMSFNSIVHKFATSFTQSPGNIPVNGMRRDFGFIQGYSLEKALDANRAAGSLINVGYQLKQTYCCLMRHTKRLPSNTILNITQTPISQTTDVPSPP